MKKIFTLAVVAFLATCFSHLSAQTYCNGYVNGHGTATQIDFTCATLEPMDIFCQSDGNYGDSPIYKYRIKLFRNGVEIAQDEPEGAESGPISTTFEDVEPLAGYYYCQIIVTRTIIGITEEVFNRQSQTITVTRPDNNTYGVCQGIAGDNFTSVCTPNTTEIIQAGTEYFVVQKEAGLIYKFSSLGNSGDNMFGISTGNPPANLPGQSLLLGTQDFATAITKIVYTPDNKTLIGFADGKLLKINGTGGTGSGMFGVTESATDFTSNGTNPTAYSGSAKFLSKINHLLYLGGQLFVSCENGNVLKATGTGGTGSNMFQVTETTTGFTNNTGGTYFVGSAHFLSAVLEIYPVSTQLFIATANSKLLKLNGTGGTGSNMFQITETTSITYANASGGTYYAGYQLFLAPVRSLLNTGTFTFIGFDYGKLLKINGTGGNGSNMFAITETGPAFATVPGYSYYSGYAKYGGVPTKMVVDASNLLFIGFSNGKMMKVQNFGGTGADMFNATETTQGFVRSTTAYPVYVTGSSAFNSNVTDIDFFGSTTTVCLINNKILKLIGAGGTGTNMFAVAQRQDGFRPLMGYTQYLTGSEVLQCIPVSALMVANKPNVTEAVHKADLMEIDATVFPNPFSDVLSVDLPEELQIATTTIEMRDLNGRLIMVCDGQLSRSMHTEDVESGVYIVIIKTDQNPVLKTIKAVKR